MSEPLIYNHDIYGNRIASTEIRCKIKTIIIIQGDWLSSDYDDMLRQLYYIPDHIPIKKTYHPITDETYITIDYQRKDLLPL